MLPLRICLLLLGGLYLLVGINSALSGLVVDSPLESLLGQNDNNLMMDNHYRFFAGVFAGCAVALVLAAWDFTKYFQAAATALAVVIIGGIARILHFESELYSNGDYIIALVFEIVVGGALLAWMLQVDRAEES